MKRTFTTIVCALLLVAMLAGCGSTGSSNPFDAKAKTFDAEGMQITLTTDFSQESLEGLYRWLRCGHGDRARPP